jgi:OsmC subfamily peroxiredoxin
MKRTATAVWNGSGKEGSGKLTTQSNVLKQTQYSYKSRFEDGVGTNPEELLAAAHAGCYSMKLSFLLGSAGFVPISTMCPGSQRQLSGFKGIEFEDLYGCQSCCAGAELGFASPVL